MCIRDRDRESRYRINRFAPYMKSGYITMPIWNAEVLRSFAVIILKKKFSVITIQGLLYTLINRFNKECDSRQSPDRGGSVPMRVLISLKKPGTSTFSFANCEKGFNVYIVHSNINSRKEIFQIPSEVYNNILAITKPINKQNCVR